MTSIEYFPPRLPLQETSELEEPYELIFVIKTIDKLPITCDDIRSRSDADIDLSKIKYYIRNGFPSKIDKSLSAFKPFINELSIAKGCIMYKDRVVP